MPFHQHVILLICLCQCIHLFHVGATFEMIELNMKKCVFRLIKIPAAQRLLSEEKLGKVAERQRERGCVRVQVLVET